MTKTLMLALTIGLGLGGCGRHGTAATSPPAPPSAVTAGTGPAATPSHTLTSKERLAFRLLVSDDLDAIALGKGGFIAGLSPDAPVPVEASQYQGAYERDPTAANAMFRQKIVLIRGRIASIEAKAAGGKYIELQNLDGASTLKIKPRAYFTDEQGPYLASLKPGLQIAFACTGAGVAAGAATVKDCVYYNDYRGDFVPFLVDQIPFGLNHRLPAYQRFAVLAIAVANKVPDDDPCLAKVAPGCPERFAGLVDVLTAPSAPQDLVAAGTRIGLDAAQTKALFAAPAPGPQAIP